MRSRLLTVLLAVITLALGFAAAARAQESLYGHLTYPEAPAESLVAVCTGNSAQLHKDVVQPLRVMIEAARADGVDLRAISCFRSIRKQQYLFCRHVCDANSTICGGSCQGRKQTEAVRALVSAPPGHSEHATGYTIDFTDGRNRKCDVETCFAETEAGQWMVKNATSYGFELSFPENNKQGVSYEPWHWRFVGTPEAMALFARARSLYPAKPAVP